MAINIGSQFGFYEITGLLGKGGMGEVYRARDIKLNREVALKVLPENFLGDPDRLSRFQREAQLLASVNHPNIAAIYGLEESDGMRALVLELVEGLTLADRLAQGPIPLAEVLGIAQQIANALEAAHEAGVVHRDLKPANIKLRDDGTVKVLDFGLAKLAETSSAAGSGVGLSQSPTLTSPAMTMAGVILGTAAYMSPEQAKGRTTDPRSDVWAFGCVVYEMLTGHRAFAGEEVPETLAYVITKDPDWTRVSPTTPASVRRLLRRCLEKDRKKRLADIADARLELDDAINASEGVLDDAKAPISNGRFARAPHHYWIAATGALLVVLLILLVLWAPWSKPTSLEPIRLSAEVGADVSLVNQGSAIALSLDGHLLAYIARSVSNSMTQLYMRRLGQLESTVLPGSLGARDPFFSPDGQWIAFFADGKLKKISITGGPPVALCDAKEARGGAWAEDDTIIFQPAGQGEALFRVQSSGGKPEPLTQLSDGETTQRWPQVLPAGKAVLYTSHNAAAGFDAANVVVQTLPNGARKIVQRGGYFGRYVASGHLVYIHEGTLFAAPFDLERLEVTGHAVPVVEGVASGPTGVGVNGASQFAISRTGLLVYMPGKSFEGTSIQWMDRAGRITPLRATTAIWSNPHFSPDGRRLAIEIEDSSRANIWIYDWSRDALSRLTFGAAEHMAPIWTPDGSRIAFGVRTLRGPLQLSWQRSDGTGEMQSLSESMKNQRPASWHPDGKILAFTEQDPETREDLMILPIDGDEKSGWKPGKPAVFLKTPFSETEPMFSPDGRWIAYSSDESGRPEIYIRPYPGPGGKWQVSSTGGSYPTWSRTKQELLYQGLDQRMMVASYGKNGDSFIADKPRLWSEQRFFVLRNRSFNLHPDGERVTIATAENPTALRQDKMVFVFNFFDELRRVAPITTH